MNVVRIVGASASRSTLPLTTVGHTMASPDGAAATDIVPATPVMTVHAHWPGAWGNKIRITTRSANIVTTTSSVPSAAGTNTITLATTSGLFPGSVITIGTTAETLAAEVQAVDTVDGIITLTDKLSTDVPRGADVISQEFTLLIERMENNNTVESEVFEQLSLASAHPRYAPDIVGSFDTVSNTPSETGNSELVRLEGSADTNTHVFTLVHAVGSLLVGGNDDIDGVNDQTYIGHSAVDPKSRSGIQAMENEDSISIVAVPGRTSVNLQKALVSHCEKMRFRFAILDTPLGSDVRAARVHRQNFDTTHAAIYYPGLVVADAFGQDGDSLAITACGHLAGIYARTDINRGVHKVPANELVKGILRFETALTRAEQGVLNPIAVNCLRDFRSSNRGLRVFGARVATSDPEWKYINVRRLQMSIEQSLEQGLQWAAFESNDRRLWSDARQCVMDFLFSVWRSGALAGNKQEEAFFVKIGLGVTMTQDDIDNGRMIAEIGVAPIRPAEFIITRIRQTTLEGLEGLEGSV